MDLGIVIVSFNTRELTLNCLDSVYRDMAASAIDGHVWVVDNASADGSSQAVNQQYPQVTLHASKDNLGFARGANLGVSLALAATSRPDYILLLNPDTLVQPGALHHLIATLRTRPKAAAAGAQLLYADGSFQHGAFRFPTLPMVFFDFWTINHRLINSRLNGRYPRRKYAAGKPFQIDHPLGAAMLMRREAWEQVGPLDEGYFMYCEEIDWCLRARRAGWDIYCVPKARIVHYAGQSTRQFRAEMFIALWRSRYRLFALHYPLIYQRLARLIVRAGLSRQISRTQLELKTGRISTPEAEGMVQAFHQVKEF